MTEPRKSKLARIIEALLFGVMYLVVNLIYSFVIARYVMGEPAVVAPRMALWNAFAALGAPVVMLIWYVAASNLGVLTWKRVTTLALACVGLPYLIVVALSAGIALGLIHLVWPAVVVAALAILIFDGLRRRVV